MVDVGAKYREIFDRRSPEELRRLAHVKRFMERLEADPAFRDKLRENADAPRRVTEAYGIDVDPMDLLPLFSPDHLKYRHTEEEARWPLAKAWSDFREEIVAHHQLLRDHGGTAELNPAFHGWRQRQITRGMSELGITGPILPHRVAAYELTDGCSVGCWFCGVSAERFKGHLPYTPESAALWRGVLQTMVGLFGTAPQTAFCYWATDPMDNPDYDRFIHDHYDVVGALPQTTTAIPLRDTALTRRVMALIGRYAGAPNRFSILNLKLLERVHAEFTAEELIGVELLARNREALRTRANAGRARERQAKQRAAGKDGVHTLSEEHTTIACVSGFLVNMPRQTVQLVSPTRAGERWPLGYRVYGEATFDDADDFRATVSAMIETHCVNTLRPDDRLAFRPDLAFTALPAGFRLESQTKVHAVEKLPFARPLGELIARGTLTAGEIQTELVACGADVFQAGGALQTLFDRGLLDDDPKYGGIGAPAATAPDVGRDVAVDPEPAAMAG